MSRTTSSILYEGLGRFTWAAKKRRLMRRATRGPSARAIAVGVLALGVIGIGAVAARAGTSE